VSSEQPLYAPMWLVACTANLLSLLAACRCRPLPSASPNDPCLQADGSAEASAALVHFGWAPGARAAHAMFGAVAKYGETSSLVSGEQFISLRPCVGIRIVLIVVPGYEVSLFSSYHSSLWVV